MGNSDDGQQRSDKRLRPAGTITGLLWYIGIYGASFLGLLLILSAFGVHSEFFNDKSETLELPIRVEYHSGLVDEIPGLDGLSVVAYGHNKVRVAFTERWAKFGYGFVIGFSFMLGLFFIAYQLRAFFREVRDGRPFAPENPGRVRKIGIVVAVCGPVYGLVTYILARMFVDQIAIPGATLEPFFDWHIGLVFLGLIIIVISQILQLGSKMQLEQDLTV